MAAGDNLALPREAVAHLDRLRALGLPERLVEGGRDAWILVAAQRPESMPLFMTLKQQQLDAPETKAFYRDLAELVDWEADDPRAEGVADRLVAMFEAADAADEDAFDTRISPELVELLDSVFLDSLPVGRRLLGLLEERGWRGWTDLERISPT